MLGSTGDSLGLGHVSQLRRAKEQSAWQESARFSLPGSEGRLPWSEGGAHMAEHDRSW